MALSKIAQGFKSSYSGSRRINTGRNQPAKNSQKPTTWGEVKTVYSQKGKGIHRRELAQWLEADELSKVDNAEYEARRMVGDTATVWHIDYSPTAAMTPRWQAYATAYGLRFILTLWLEDVEFINTVTGAGIGKSDFTPSKWIELVVKRADAKHGLSGASGVWHNHAAVFVGEEAAYQAPATKKFEPKPVSWPVWVESPFKSVGKTE